MTKHLLSSLTGATSVLLISALNSSACGTGTTTITNLADLAGDTFQVAALGSSGQITGYFYGMEPHAFLYTKEGKVIDLGSLGGGYSQGMGINASGQVVGSSLLPDYSSHAFLYSSNQLMDLGTLGGTYSNPGFINDNGAVVGIASLASGDTVAFLYTNGPLVSLGTLGGTYSSAFCINNSGVICGESSIASGDIHGFVYSGGAMADVGTLGGGYSSCSAINSSGTAIGDSYLANGDTHAFTYSGGAITDLGTLGGTYSSAAGINAAGQIIGSSTTLNDSQTHGFVFTGGAMRDLGSLGGGYSSAFAVNDQGQVVGESSTTTGATDAFVWQNGTMTDLNTLLPPNSGWQLFSARFLNNAGRVVGFGLYNGASKWFIMDLGSSNQPPVACAGPNQTIDCQSSVTLDGSCSSDADGDALSFEWSTSGTVLGTQATLTTSFPLGTNVVTLKVTDACGASTQTNVTVVVTDTTPPTGSCPAAMTAASDANCQAAVPNVVSQVIASDNCTPTGSLLISQNPPAGTLVGLGPHPITVTVADAFGNTFQCGALFTVVDTTPPVIASVPGPITLSATAQCQASVPNLLPSIVVTDTCTPANQIVVTQNPAAGTLLPLGQYAVTITATDAAGNSASAGISLSIADTTAPTIVSVPGPITLSTTSQCKASVPNLVPNVLATDNCTPANQLVITQTPIAGTSLPLGQYVVTITATDAAGNSATAGVGLTVADTTPPVIQALTASPNVLSPPNHQLVPVTISPLVSDSCDSAPASKIINITASEPTSPGDIQITGNLTATLAASKDSNGTTRTYTITVQSSDASGNASTATVIVTVPKSSGTSSGTTSAVRRPK